MKSALKTIQADFQDYVLGVHKGAPAIAASIVEQFGLKASDRLAIYHNAYRLRICEALSKAYDKTHAYLGDEMFEELALGYIAEHPSQYSNMRWYGERFASYIALTLPDYPAVAELARFEWTLSLSFDAEDSPVLTGEELGTITDEQWETIGFNLSRSLHFVPMHTNAVAIWLALDQEQSPPDAMSTVDPIPWLIWRKALQPHFRSLDTHEASALRALQQGESFSAVCDQIAEASDNPEIMNKIAGWLQIWLAEEILSGTTLQN